MTEREHSVTVRRVFRATSAQLYRAWTDLDAMREWMGARVEADVRVGGHYRREVDGGDAGSFVHVGRFETLEPNRRIVQSFGLEGMEGNLFVDEQIEVLLEPLGPDETELLLIDRWNGPPMTAEETRDADQAWGDWLMKMEQVLRPGASAGPTPPA